MVCTALASLRFPSPLIKPDVRISRIRLSDWLHPEAHGGGGAKMNPAQPKHAEIPEHGLSREPRGAARRNLVTPDQKMPHALIDVRKSGSAFALR